MSNLTCSPARKLDLSRLLSSLDGVEHGCPVGADAICEEDTESETDERTDGGEGRDLLCCGLDGIPI